MCNTTYIVKTVGCENCAKRKEKRKNEEKKKNESVIRTVSFIFCVN